MRIRLGRRRRGGETPEVVSMDASDRYKSAAEKSRASATETATGGEDGEEKAGGEIGDAATATEAFLTP